MTLTSAWHGIGVRCHSATSCGVPAPERTVTRGWSARNASPAHWFAATLAEVDVVEPWLVLFPEDREEPDEPQATAPTRSAIGSATRIRRVAPRARRDAVEVVNACSLSISRHY